MVHPSISGMNIGDGDGVLVALTRDGVGASFGDIECRILEMVTGDDGRGTRRGGGGCAGGGARNGARAHFALEAGDALDVVGSGEAG